MKTLKFAVLLATFSFGVFGSAGELSPAMRALFRTAQEQRVLSAKEIVVDLEKASTEGLRVPVGDYELTLATSTNSDRRSFILMKMNSARRGATGQLRKVNEEALKAWRSRLGRDVDLREYEAADGSTIIQLTTYSEPVPLLKFIIEAAQRLDRGLAGSAGL